MFHKTYKKDRESHQTCKGLPFGIMTLEGRVAKLVLLWCPMLIVIALSIEVIMEIADPSITL